MYYTPPAAVVRTAEQFADVIALDLGIVPGCPVSYRAVFDLTQRYGGHTFEISEMDERDPGFHILLYGTESFIFVARCLHSKAKATVVLHELIHRLLYSDAYETLNEAQHSTCGWDKPQMHEEICRAVERRFVDCGGFDFRNSLRKA